MASWQYSYNKGCFSITLPVILKVWKLLMPLSKLYDVIDSARLNPEIFKLMRPTKLNVMLRWLP
ncbi:MAG: hypothetical protein ACLRSL_04030 [Streptococcus sp.]